MQRACSATSGGLQLTGLLQPGAELQQQLVQKQQRVPSHPMGPHHVGGCWPWHLIAGYHTGQQPATTQRWPGPTQHDGAPPGHHRGHRHDGHGSF